jgi:preprotein translocase subunit SecF
MKITTIGIVTLAALALLVTGCGLSFEHDPEKTVTVEISGITEEADREQVQEMLKGLTDGSSSVISTMSSGDQMTVTLSPVSDAEALSRKITFGTVTGVEERTVRIDFAGAAIPEL